MKQQPEPVLPTDAHGALPTDAALRKDSPGCSLGIRRDSFSEYFQIVREQNRKEIPAPSDHGGCNNSWMTPSLPETIYRNYHGNKTGNEWC